MLAITIRRERTGHWIRMRRPLARFSKSDASCHTPWLAGCITNTSGFKFSARTGENALGRVHAVDVLGRGLDPDEDDLPVLGLERLGLVGGEHDLAGRGAWRCRKPGGDDLALGIGIDGAMQELVERARIDAGDRLLAGDQTFV